MIRIPIMVGREYKAVFETHEAMHFDEIIAFLLIEEFGDEQFLRQYIRGDTIKVGIGGGPFDEHPRATTERKNGECAATLVAKALGIDKDPGLKEILQFALERDLKAGSQPFDLASLVKIMSHRDPKKIIDWVRVAIGAKYQNDLAFRTVTKPEFKKTAKVEFLRSGKNVVKMAVVLSDDEQIQKFSRSSGGPGAAITIQKKNSGNVQVYTSLKFKIRLDDVARMVNLTEQQAGGRILSTDWKILSQEGMIPGGRWHYFPQGGMILNGSLTHPEVPPTHLSLEQIERIVRIGVDSSLFPRHCINSRYCLLKECDWYSWGLTRCQIRRR